MKGYSQNQKSSLVTKLATKFHFFNVITYFIIFICGITLGVILTSSQKHLKFTELFISTSAHTNPTQTSQNRHDDRIPKTPAIIEKTCLTKPATNNNNSNATRDGAWHDMSEEELLRRASMVPRVVGATCVPPKVAFMFLVKGQVYMWPLWEKFFKGREGLFSIYVHSSPLYNRSMVESPLFQGRRIPSKIVEWGKISMIEAERRLLANAVLDPSNQRFVLLSESCIPLYDFDTIYNYLISANKTHVDSFDDPGLGGRGRYDNKMYPVISLEEWRKGSQWFVANRNLAIEVVSDKKYFPVFQKVCEGSCMAEEHYLPTLVNIKFLQNNLNRSLTWADWSNKKSHPESYGSTEITIDLLRGMRNSSWECVDNENTTNLCFLFARKFMPSSVDRLVELASTIMHI